MIPAFMNQVWNFSLNQSGKIEVIAGEISEKAPTSYDTLIATIASCAEEEMLARLITHAPDMFKVICNLGGEIDDGTALVPEFIVNDIDNIISDVVKKEKANEGETE